MLLTEIDKKDNFSSARLELFKEEKPFHVCGNCSNCAATLPKNGGCLQVFENRYIHNYPFIKLGIETYGCRFVLNKILKCDNYKKGRLKVEKPSTEYFV